MILEQQQYDPVEQAGLIEEYRANLNADQQAAFKRITSAIADRIGETFFLHRPGGIGKTYCISIIHSAINCALSRRLCFMLHPLELQHFS